MLSESIRNCVKGNIVDVNLIPGKPPRRFEVVQNWTKDEPPQLLVTDPTMRDGKCYIVLAVDATFISE